MLRFKENNICIEDYFKRSSGKFKACKVPKRKPDFVSRAKGFIVAEQGIDHVEALRSRNISQYQYSHSFIDLDGQLRVYYYTNRVSSRYWYGEDKRGKYVIRESDHWGNINNCHWTTTLDHKYRSKNCGKIYFK